MSGPELDVRPLPKPGRHPAVFAAYDALAVGDSLVLVNDHDPRRLREEFATEHPGGHDWRYEDKAPGEWRIRIRKLASTPLPRVLTGVRPLVSADSSDSPASPVSGDFPDTPDGRDASAVTSPGVPDASGAVWKLRMRDRDLDSNIIQLPPHAGIAPHLGPDLDVLVHVLDGDGRLTTELGQVPLAPGDLVWLPRRSQRAFTAGPRGLRYLTVHQRRQALVLAPPSPRV
ncbi:DUF2249 domain-containing protein [Streptomyces sp. CBMA29]|uniref:DUF2249 domain-containing protein n=1 Tax=Streptomyces sp. CBMA29 TaxID=1896314 RepID=UPI0016618DC9|nr:DUF2249 domain-containing protein [Streptomyces sp. CBMA29]MBD0740634.1 hypothetical protein [Streptomyces sp. CBMA29]